jgi:hypothetical protein
MITLNAAGTPRCTSPDKRASLKHPVHTSSPARFDVFEHSTIAMPSNHPRTVRRITRTFQHRPGILPDRRDRSPHITNYQRGYPLIVDQGLRRPRQQKEAAHPGQLDVSELETPNRSHTRQGFIDRKRLVDVLNNHTSQNCIHYRHAPIIRHPLDPAISDSDHRSC